MQPNQKDERKGVWDLSNRKKNSRSLGFAQQEEEEEQEYEQEYEQEQEKTTKGERK